MEKVKKTAEYTIYKRTDGRYAVKDKRKKPVNGDQKVEILQAEGYLKKPEPKPVEEAPAEEAAEGSEESAE